MPKRERAEYMRKFRAERKRLGMCIECSELAVHGTVRCTKHNWNRVLWKRRTPEERAVAAAMKKPTTRRGGRQKKPKTDYLHR